MKRRSALLAGGAVFCCSFLRAAVIVTEFAPAHEVFDSTLGHLEPFDLNGDGSVDITFSTFFAGTSLRTERANRIIIRLHGAPDIGGPITPVPLGGLIGATPPAGNPWPLFWASTDFVDGFVSPGENSFNGIVLNVSTGEASDFSGRAPVGIEFAAADGLHYGFLDITAGPGYSGITLHGYAYETQPGVPIIAGAVPEPSALLLLASGLAVPLCRRWRRPAAEPTALRNPIARTQEVLGQVKQRNEE